MLSKIKNAFRTMAEFLKYPYYFFYPRHSSELQFNKFNHYHVCLARLTGGAETFGFLCPILSEQTEESEDIKKGFCGSCNKCDTCPYSARVDYTVENDKACLQLCVDRSVLANDTFTHYIHADS